MSHNGESLYSEMFLPKKFKQIIEGGFIIWAMSIFRMADEFFLFSFRRGGGAIESLTPCERRYDWGGGSHQKNI